MAGSDYIGRGRAHGGDGPGVGNAGWLDPWEEGEVGGWAGSGLGEESQLMGVRVRPTNCL